MAVRVRLTLVGTGTISLSATRSCACHHVDAGEVQLLFDCGPGSGASLVRHGLDWWNITHIALTHFHHDHIGDLPTLIFAWRHARWDARTAPLTILGPAGTSALIDRWSLAIGDWLRNPGFPVTVVELPLETPTALSTEVTLASRAVPHTPESVAYSLDQAGRRLVFTGDMSVDASLGEWAAGCHTLLADCSFPDALPNPVHMTPKEVGVVAAAARPDRVVLTHLYPPAEDVDLAAEVHPHWPGPVVVGYDGLSLEI
jgi:ribonuclease BN (tRNA processing enzyme)